MDQVQSSAGNAGESIHGKANSPSFSLAERELNEFIHSVSNLIGAELTTFLRELWLDEVASIGRTPEPASPEWHLVTLGASAKLACRLLEVGCQEGLL
jgi:hypothetical protein